MQCDKVYDPVPARYREVYPERVRPVVVVKGAKPPEVAVQVSGPAREVREESSGGWARFVAGWARFAGEKV